MKTFLRMISDRQTMVLTLPNLDFGSLNQNNLAKLRALFRHAANRFRGQTLILDVSAARSAGAAFLTQVHEFASALDKINASFVIAGDVDGLIRLVGWNRRFRCYPSLVDAVLAASDRQQRLSMSTCIP